MSFGPPLSVGHSSAAEYLDLEFERPPAADLLETLNPLLPDGLRIAAWRPILYRTSSLMSAIDSAAYRIHFTGAFRGTGTWNPSDTETRLSDAIADWMQRDHILVRRNGRDGAKEVDLRPSVEALEPLFDGAGLDCWIRFTPRAQARPEEVLSILVPGPDPRLSRVERTGMWSTAGDRRLDPFELLSSAAAPVLERSRAMG
jgi:radical SAM-linked protein